MTANGEGSGSSESIAATEQALRAHAYESQRANNLEAALRSMRTLASIAHEGDPWYAENEGIDASAIFAHARAALGEEPKS